MRTYVALLRGINVGGNKQISMTELRLCFESLGFERVSTYINSGNVIFMSTIEDRQDLTNKIQSTLKEVFGYDLKVLIRDGSNIQTLAKTIPTKWLNDSEQRTDLLFLSAEFDREETIDLIKTNPEIDHLIYCDGAIAWNIDRTFYSKSGLHAFIGTIVYKNMTARNVNTVRKLANLIKDYDKSSILEDPEKKPD